MFSTPTPIGQLARQHHHDMLAQASQRNQLGRHSAPNAAGLIARHLARAIARAGVVAAETAGATWPITPHLLTRQAGQPSTPDRSH